MKIGITGIRGIPARYGGFETFVENLAPRLVQLGHSVTVYNRPRFGNGLSEFQGVRLKLARAIHNKYLETFSHTFCALWDATFRESFDVLLVCNVGNSPLLLIPRLKRLPVLLNVDGLEWRRKKWPWFAKVFLRMAERIATTTATQIVTDADVIQEYYRQRYAKDSVMIPYASDGSRVRGARDDEFLASLRLQREQYLLYVSRLEPENNADMVIRAFLKVADQLSNSIRLAIVGDAPYADGYKEIISELAARDSRILLLGAIYGEGYAILQRNAKAYIQATEVGGTHPALVEAMAYGNCVMAYNTPENVEVSGGATLTFASEDELATLLQKVDSDAINARVFGDGAERYARAKYSWATITQQYESALLNLGADALKEIGEGSAQPKAVGYDRHD